MDLPQPTGPLTLRIGVFFDGTGNNQGNSVAPGGTADGRLGSYGNAPSNVALLHGLYPQASDGASTVYLRCYIEGIGTWAGKDDSAFAQATGLGRSGVEARVAQAAQAIAGQMRAWLASRPQAQVVALEFDLFGFSRGAAAARHLANDLGKGGDSLLARTGVLGEGFDWQARPVINFIGLFDTVAAIVEPLKGNFSPANDRYAGLQLGLAAGAARKVVQLVAADEQRHNFPLVRSDNDIVVPGSHSDIGGGYLECMVEQMLLSKPRSNLVPVRTPVEQTQAYILTTAQLARDHAHTPAPAPRVLTWEEPVERSDPRDEPYKRVYAAIHREREVRGHLSRVYLRIMRELAVRAQVPFAEVDERGAAFCLPQELQEISDKLHDFALGRSTEPGLTVEQRQLLEARYIHASAHWNALKGLRNSELDVVYIDRPAEGGRVMHGNR
ncbi:DUF2235 domain-containing protein [Pseudomonas putida]|uniref:T6SS phospholipase effector Tle1-like catalytic domain-containing protein n=1 Tax=Pseudomonas putida TaxID=303 RepID=UPI002D1E9B38|nr:DUF2235 domain-containing protein [Pseudomonas putida]MEB3901957.1 DUF2235 domain-containing protein [Pseudomonas putida]